jgi:hypothetical protein
MTERRFSMALKMWVQPRSLAGMLVITVAAGLMPTSIRAGQGTAFEAYCRFDFVPGEKIVALDDFSQDSFGDFPAKWDTNASARIVTIAGRTGRWLKLAGRGVFVPEFPAALPENFTLDTTWSCRPPSIQGTA